MPSEHPPRHRQNARHAHRHSEMSGNLLIGWRSIFRDFSECPLMDQTNYVDSDSAIASAGDYPSAVRASERTFLHTDDSSTEAAATSDSLIDAGMRGDLLALKVALVPLRDRLRRDRDAARHATRCARRNDSTSRLDQRAFRHVHVSSSTEITMDFSFVGIQGRREGAIGSYRAFGGSSRDRSRSAWLT
jgi:hypothetical protein